MANQPSLIPSAWAANNSTTETIPATTTESGKASWDQGFPVETSLPLSEGGIPPKYGDFNGILNVLSQFCLFAQAGGQFTWSSTLAYSVGSIVVGSDGSIYRAVQATTNVNPVGDTSGKWERIVSQSDITALEADIQTAMTNASDAVSNASAAQSAVSTLDANVVKLSGDQTIGGTKTFTSGIHGNTSELRVQNDKTDNDGVTSIYGGAGYATGGYLSVYGISNSSYPGWFRVVTTTGPVTKALVGKPDGTLLWDSKNVLCVSDSGSNYIRFSSGLQICWGNVSVATASTAVTFPKAFSATPEIVFGLRPGSASEKLYNVLAYPRSSTGFTAYANDAAGHMAAIVSYIAIGSWA